MLGALGLAMLVVTAKGQEKTDGAQQTDDKSKKPQVKDKDKEAQEQEAQSESAAQSLQKATQNPVASLVSVPFQNNSNFGVNPGYRTQDVLNIQPVVPIGISKDWNLLVRWIVPIVWQPVPAPPPVPEIGKYGFGDMQPTFFLSPKHPGKLIWGVGPFVVIPTASSEFTGQGKLSLGPSIVLLTQPGHWTLGVLTNNATSVAGPRGRPDVNQFLLQWFVNYNLKKGWYLSASPTVTADWEQTNGGRWVVPFGGGAGRIMKLGFQPVNISVKFFGNAVHPPTGPSSSSWSAQVTIALLYPKLTKEMKQMLLEKQLKQLEQEPPPKQ